MVEYDFYKYIYKGVSIDSLEWPAYEARAAAQLARYNRIYTVTAPDENAEAMAICAMSTSSFSGITPRSGLIVSFNIFKTSAMNLYIKLDPNLIL